LQQSLTITVLMTEQQFQLGTLPILSHKAVKIEVSTAPNETLFLVAQILH
jgi:hypothetical protein